MKERPIIFSGPMVRAILDGRKTQTRRVVKPPKNVDPKHWMPEKLWDGQFNALHWPADHAEHKILKCPYGQPGDRLWVRETFAQTDCRHEFTPLAYRATDKGHALLDDKWIPSIYMPRWASRITLEITNIRVERLQDISEKDAEAEGIERTVTNDGWRRYCNDPDQEACGLTPCGTAKQSYQSLWGSINGTDSWNANPWVWVVEFRRVKPC